MANNYIEYIVAVVLGLLAIVLLNPTGIYMPNMVLMSIIALTIAAFALFASFVIRENKVDERDAIHRMFAGRIAFLTGSALLTLGIVYKAYFHAVDPWLVAALLGMVFAKLASRIYSDKNL